MNHPIYLDLASCALKDLDNSIAHVMRFLPEAVKAQHWQAEKRGELSSWSSVRFWYQQQDDAIDDIIDLLVHLSLLSTAKVALQTVLQPLPQNPPNLTLARTRRTA